MWLRVILIKTTKHLTLLWRMGANGISQILIVSFLILDHFMITVIISSKSSATFLFVAVIVLEIWLASWNIHEVYMNTLEKVLWIIIYSSKCLTFLFYFCRLISVSFGIAKFGFFSSSFFFFLEESIFHVLVLYDHEKYIFHLIFAMTRWGYLFLSWLEKVHLLKFQ